MNCLIDTNVVLDVISHRQRYAVSQKVFDIVDEDRLSAFVIATSVTNISYILYRESHDRELVFKQMRMLFDTVGILDVHARDIYEAYARSWRDFEDAVRMAVAYNCGMDCVITNNKKDFEEALVPVMTPEEFCASMRE